MIYLPFLGAISLAAGTILEKIVVKRKNIDIKFYQTAIFFVIMLVMLPFIYFYWKFDPQALQPLNIIIFSLVIIFSLLANWFVFYSVKGEKVSNLEPAKMIEPLFVVLLAILFSFFIDSGMYEKNLKIIIPAIIAGLALILSHIKRHHLKFNKYFLSAILGSFFFALELVISRLILDYYSSLTFYFLRCAFIFLFSLIIFRPKMIQMDKTLTSYIFITGIFWVLYRVIIYYGYVNLGIIFTTLIIMVSPIFIYLFAHIFLKENLSWRNIIASIIIIGCVLYATIF
ncbi:MAG TPA: EamA family transporter [Candidatus Nanoarchaeia archaeon]|nr:EamA family transporter [Candidatus Nanoarchaeia archaeon]